MPCPTISYYGTPSTQYYTLPLSRALKHTGNVKAFKEEGLNQKTWSSSAHFPFFAPLDLFFMFVSKLILFISRINVNQRKIKYKSEHA